MSCAGITLAGAWAPVIVAVMAMRSSLPAIDGVCLAGASGPAGELEASSVSMALAAFAEDAAGCGMQLDDALAGRLAAARSKSESITLRTYGGPGAPAYFDLPVVRVWHGPGADELLSYLGADGCCAGADIFMHRTVLAGRSAVSARDLLLHEMCHAAAGSKPGLVRLWRGSGHEDLTSLACQEYRAELQALVADKGGSPEWSDFVRTLRGASTTMDYAGRLAHPVGTFRYVTGAAKGEGPYHGEGLNYTVADTVTNESVNVKAQAKYVADAVSAIKRGDPSWIRNLGNALHIAQDRASHREGTEGYGHDDPRCRAADWNPDSPACDDSRGSTWLSCGKAAYNRAFNNSCEVLEAFLRQNGVSPASKARRPLRCR